MASGADCVDMTVALDPPELLLVVDDELPVVPLVVVSVADSVEIP